MRTLFLCLIAVAAHAATTVYQASVDQLTVVHGAAAPDADGPPHRAQVPPRRTRRPVPRRLIRSAPVSLTIGKRYELTGWVRTENLTVRDTSTALRSPPAPRSPWRRCRSTSTPSRSAARTPWTRLSLKFIATAPQDRSC